MSILLRIPTCIGECVTAKPVMLYTSDKGGQDMPNETNSQPNEERMPFRPNEHVIQLKGKNGSADYLPCQWRLVWFREQCPHGTIETEELEVDLDREMEEEGYAWNNETRRSEKITKRAKGYARFKATVTDGKGGKATGTK